MAAVEEIIPRPGPEPLKWKLLLLLWLNQIRDKKKSSQREKKGEREYNVGCALNTEQSSVSHNAVVVSSLNG